MLNIIKALGSNKTQRIGLGVAFRKDTAVICVDTECQRFLLDTISKEVVLQRVEFLGILVHTCICILIQMTTMYANPTQIYKVSLTYDYMLEKNISGRKLPTMPSLVLLKSYARE